MKSYAIAAAISVGLGIILFTLFFNDSKGGARASVPEVEVASVAPVTASIVPAPKTLSIPITPSVPTPSQPDRQQRVTIASTPELPDIANASTFIQQLDNDDQWLVDYCRNKADIAAVINYNHPNLGVLVSETIDKCFARYQ